jgi:hypothetical protein
MGAVLAGVGLPASRLAGWGDGAGCWLLLAGRLAGWLVGCRVVATRSIQDLEWVCWMGWGCLRAGWLGGAMGLAGWLLVAAGCCWLAGSATCRVNRSDGCLDANEFEEIESIESRTGLVAQV